MEKLYELKKLAFWLLIIFSTYYIYGWLEFPYKLDALEKQLKRIADALEKD